MVAWRMPSNDVQVELFRSLQPPDDVQLMPAAANCDAALEWLTADAEPERPTRPVSASARAAISVTRRVGGQGSWTFPRCVPCHIPCPATWGLKHERLRSGRRTPCCPAASPGVRRRCRTRAIGGPAPTPVDQGVDGVRRRPRSARPPSRPARCAPSRRRRAAAACRSAYQRNETPWTRPVTVMSTALATRHDAPAVDVAASWVAAAGMLAR